ncbi:MAG: FAD-dependent oxidoreductase [Frankiales bacterium]|nr:FAD-dependent oxidoreductase [Frankiales bacterium]
MTDAVVIGAGPNGLVAANLLVDAGWDVIVLEAQSEPGGAVRSGELTAPGFQSDRFSAFYPLGLASPVLRDLRLEEHGLRWTHAPDVLGHPLLDGRAAVLSRSLEVTAASVEAFAPGDGAAWRGLAAEWDRLSPALLDALFTPFPPVRAGARLLRVLGAADALRFARFAMLSTRRHGAEEFGGQGGPLLLAGNALHTDLAPGASGSAIYGWLLAMLGQTVGFPVPEGGAGRLTDALVQRLRSRGGRLECDATVTEVVVRQERAVAVRTADGRTVDARRAVLADVTAPQLFLGLVGADHLSSRMLADLRRFQWDDATVKVDWALSAPIPWGAGAVARAGTVHVGGEMDDLVVYSQSLERGQVPARPFVIVGQMTTSDPTRSPAGTESAWGYTHVPARPKGDAGGELRGDWSPGDRQRFVDRIEAQMERYAPGFGQLVVGRHVQFPADLQRADANLSGGAVNGGTAGIHQQLVFRPTPGAGRAETPIAGLYLASSSAHPGGGVHGACGANAARAALRAGSTGRMALAATRLLSGSGPAAPAAAASRRSAP